MRFSTLIASMALIVVAAGLWPRAIATATPTAGSCPVGAPTRQLAPTPGPTDGYDAFPPGIIWYRNRDGTLWAHPWEPWRAGGTGIKVGWIKPAGSILSVSGTSLSKQPHALRASVPRDYPGHFQASGLLFPVAGCWDITAKAVGHTLRFVVRVAPRLR